MNAAHRRRHDRIRWQPNATLGWLSDKRSRRAAGVARDALPKVPQVLTDIVIALVTGVLTGGLVYAIGRWDGRRLERRIREEVSMASVRTASIVESVFSPLLEDVRPGESERGCDMEYRATVGWADVTGRDRHPRDLLIEYSVGAHSMALIVFEENLELSQVKILGQLNNGGGFSFHIGDFTGEGRVEIGTIDYIRDLPLDRPLFDAPIQAVYDRWDGSEFGEAGRGPAHDPRQETEAPPSIRRFMGEAGTSTMSFRATSLRR